MLLHISQISCSVVSDSLQSHGLQHTSLLCPSPTPRACSRLSVKSVMPSNHLILCCPLLLLPSIFHQDVFRWASSLHQVAKVLEFQLQHQSFQWIVRTDFLLDGLVGSPCSPRDSQESSPTKQFKIINSSVLSFLYSPTLTSIHDYMIHPCIPYQKLLVSGHSWLSIDIHRMNQCF